MGNNGFYGELVIRKKSFGTTSTQISAQWSILISPLKTKHWLLLA